MKQIVIIEDDPQLQLVYTSLLTNAGYTVTCEAAGHQGLTLIRSQRPDLVLLDIMLPDGINGFDVLEDMKRTVETKDIPVIMLSNLDSEGESAKNVGADAYFVKVNTPNELLLSTIKKLLHE